MEGYERKAHYSKSIPWGSENKVFVKKTFPKRSVDTVKLLFLPVNFLNLHTSRKVRMFVPNSKKTDKTFCLQERRNI